MQQAELERHAVREVRSLRVSSSYPREVGLNARRGIHGHGPTTQVRVITTDQGAQGWGISPHPDDLLPDLRGRRLTDLFDPGLGVIADEALGLDIALHDLAATILGVPVDQMLGAHGARQVPCYDGAIYIDDLLPPEQPRGVDGVIDHCRHDYELGYRAFKLKIGRGYRWMDAEDGLRRDVEVTRRIRTHFPDCRILVDANDGYTCGSFLRYLEAVADCDLFWVEEPFPENREDLLRLRDALARISPGTLIADGESDPDRDHLLRLAREGLIDVLIPDIIGMGFTAWRRWMPSVRDAGAQASPHTWGDPLKTCYAAQLAGGLGNVVTVEGVPATSSSADWSGYILEEGILRLPATPGFGIALRES